MSEPTTYHIEHASSGRAKCKKCKIAIAKGELRIGTTSQGPNDYTMTSFQHPKCFVVPPRAMKGVSPEDFVANHLVDQTDDDVLSNEDTRQEIIDAIAYKPPKGGSAKKGGDDGGEQNAIQKKLADIKAVMDKLPESDSEDDNDDERPAKKARKSEGNEVEMSARAMKIYSGMKNDDLKNVLRWNGHMIGGNKDVLLLRCIDGHVHGRLARCPTCFKGKVNLNEDDAGATVICKGFYDEDISARIPCGYKTNAASASRLHPWYSEEPTEEEMEAMKAITEKHEGIAGGKGDGEVPPELLQAAEDIKDWDETDVKVKAQLMVDICSSGKTKVDIPQDETKARRAVGKLLLANSSASAVEFLKLVVGEFGIASVKEDAKEKQKAAMATSCTVAANAGIIQAFQELKDYYFKEGNGNAGGTYQKAITALLGLEYEITSANAKGLCKGKTKLPGIGKGTGDKIFEYYTTGTIQKLEEKRLLNSS